MNILVLTGRSRGNKYNGRLHLGFLLGLRRFKHKIDIVYRFNVSNLSAKDLVKIYKPDILLCYMFQGIDYKQISSVGCCKVMIEIDFCKKVEDGSLGWYKRCGFDLLIRRGPYKLDLDIGVPQVWLPFSASIKEFYPDDSIERDPIVTFAGSRGADIYQPRRNAIEKLKSAGIYREYRRAVTGYPEKMRKSLMWLTSAEMGSPRGKVFEAMASGTIVLTPPFMGEKSLFGNKKCYIRYAEDCSDIVDKAMKAIKSPAFASIIRKNAFEVFHQSHTHEKRLRELETHLENVLHGRKVTHFWSVD